MAMLANFTILSFLVIHGTKVHKPLAPVAMKWQPTLRKNEPVPLQNMSKFEFGFFYCICLRKTVVATTLRVEFRSAHMITGLGERTHRFRYISSTSSDECLN